VTPEQLLDYEIALLLAKHGEKRVVTALGRRLGLSSEELQRRLSELNKVRPRTSTPKPVDASRIIGTIAAEKPEKVPSLKLLLARFQNKTFLPELKDVRRFFDRHSHALGTVKSRAEAAPRLFKLLGTLDASELGSLCEGDQEKEYSSLGIISDEIMRRDK
jgi:hypothetical protein